MLTTILAFLIGLIFGFGLSLLGVICLAIRAAGQSPVPDGFSMRQETHHQAPQATQQGRASPDASTPYGQAATRLEALAAGQSPKKRRCAFCEATRAAIRSLYGATGGESTAKK